MQFKLIRLQNDPIEIPSENTDQTSDILTDSENLESDEMPPTFIRRIHITFKTEPLYAIVYGSTGIKQLNVLHAYCPVAMKLLMDSTLKSLKVSCDAFLSHQYEGVEHNILTVTLIVSPGQLESDLSTTVLREEFNELLNINKRNAITDSDYLSELGRLDKIQPPEYYVIEIPFSPNASDIDFCGNMATKLSARHPGFEEALLACAKKLPELTVVTELSTETLLEKGYFSDIHTATERIRIDSTFCLSSEQSNIYFC
ncbi:unnamed protein product [Schistosoma turkestanicum]|nr:unnamed protein product [Schistosoma turkestanicum]